MDDVVQRKAREFCRDFAVQSITKEQATNILEKLGYTLVEFNYILNDEPVATLIDKLKLSDEIIRTKGFTYVDDRNRLVFVNEDLNEQEQLLVILHEIGHIYCGHFSHSNIIGLDVKEEHEANEFVHYVLQPAFFDRLRYIIARHKTRILIGVGVLLLLIVVLLALNYIRIEQQYYGEYYVTDSGQKYHKKECIFVKDKDNVHRLTEEEFYSGNYEPCQICLPK